MGNILDLQSSLYAVWRNRVRGREERTVIGTYNPTTKTLQSLSTSTPFQIVTDSDGLKFKYNGATVCQIGTDGNVKAWNIREFSSSVEPVVYPVISLSRQMFGPMEDFALISKDGTLTVTGKDGLQEVDSITPGSQAFCFFGNVSIEKGGFKTNDAFSEGLLEFVYEGGKVLLRAPDGQTYWFFFKAGVDGIPTPAVDDRPTGIEVPSWYTVMLLGNDGNSYALAAANVGGEIRYTAELGADGDADPLSIQCDDGNVYPLLIIGDGNPDPTGHPAADTGSPTVIAPHLVGGALLLPCDDGNTYWLRLVALNGQITYQADVVPSGIVLNPNEIAALDSGDSTLLGRELRLMNRNGVITLDCQAYPAYSYGTVLALDCNDGHNYNLSLFTENGNVHPSIEQTHN